MVAVTSILVSITKYTRIQQIKERITIMMRKMYGKIASRGLVELIGQFRTGLIVAILTIIGMKIAETLTNTTISKKQPIILIGWTKKETKWQEQE